MKVNGISTNSAEAQMLGYPPGEQCQGLVFAEKDEIDPPPVFTL